MIKIIKATYIEEYSIKLEFSDNTFSAFDFSYLLTKNTSLTNPLRDRDYFKEFFLELGALCWKNGLQLSPSSLYQKAKESGKLQKSEIAA
jgi:hypothetical protein